MLWCLNGLHHAILYVLSARWRENNILEFFGVWHANQLQTKYSINTNKCGDLEIPYPFGVNEGCSLDETFLITCNNNKVEKSNKVTVKSISIEDHEMRVSQLVAWDCYDQTGNYVKSNTTSMLHAAMYTISNTKNKFTIVGWHFCKPEGVPKWRTWVL